jgi:hypothetical protein
LKRFYYIALKNGQSCEGIWRSESIDTARSELEAQRMDEINIALLRSDNVDFLDMEPPIGDGVTS